MVKANWAWPSCKLQDDGFLMEAMRRFSGCLYLSTLSMPVYIFLYSTCISSIYIYIYGTPPPRPILSQNLLVFALFCCFLLCLNVCFFLASILYFQKVV